MSESRDERASGGGQRISMTLYTRAQCPLCDEMKAEIERADVAHLADLEVIDIDGDPALVLAHGNSVPVLSIGGRPAFKGRCTAEDLRKKLARRSAGARTGPTARIYILSGPDLGKSVEVCADATLGRSPECTVRLRDPSVSRVHARIAHDGDRFQLVDAGSRNGITRDGKRETSIDLDNGCEFALGEVLLRFRHAEPARAAHVEAPSDLEREPEREIDRHERQVAPIGGAEHAPSYDVELEGEWSQTDAARDLAATTARPMRAALPSSEPAPSAPRVLPRTAAFSAPTVDPARRATTPLRTGNLPARARTAQGSSGLFGADLAQLPWWMRALLFAGALALAALVFLLAFQGTRLLRGRAQSVESTPSDG